MEPYIASEKRVPEFTLRALILGMILGLLFGVENAYLGLKVGTTVSASIPAAVMSMGILRLFFKRVSILENNLVQTIASVGEALAAGAIFTVPALFILGEPPSIGRIFLLSALGGILGVLFMIPMRRYIIVKEHGKLPFPEGTACAEILKSGESGRSKAFVALIGIATGAFYRILMGAFYLWNEIPTWTFARFQRTEFAIDGTPALLGVGFIVGPRISGYLLGGGLLGWWVLIPLIRLFGEGMQPIFPGEQQIANMSSDAIWSDYIRYIGAGTVAIGGLLGLFKIFPMCVRTLQHGYKELFEGSGRKAVVRTDRDISLRYLILGSLAIILALWLIPGLSMNFLTILLLVILGFFFSAVTSLTVGIIGSTSNPVSGMIICTLLITCLIFVSLGWTERIYLIAALTMGMVATITIALAGTTSQDLKTGYLLGATPRAQQIGEMFGVLLPALAIGGTLYLLNAAYGFGSKTLPAPQATMIALVTKGVMMGQIPTVLVMSGVILGLILFLIHVPILPFALGLYLPLSLSTGMAVGGIVAVLVKKISKNSAEKEATGILASSGLVAGDAVMGVILALLTVVGWTSAEGNGLFPDEVGLLIYGLLAAGLCLFSLVKKFNAP